MPTYKLKIIKKPADKQYVDIKPNFPPFEKGSLYLDLLENKKKLKPGLPLIAIKKSPTVKKIQTPAPSPAPSLQSSPQPSPKSERAKDEGRERKKSLSPKEKKREKEQREKDASVEEAMMKELGEDLEERKGRDDDRHRSKDEPSSSSGGGSRPSDSHPEDSKPSEEEEEPPQEDVDDRPQEEKDEDERQEYLVKFRILKKQYKTGEFPIYTEHTDLPTLKRMYNDTFRMITLDENVKNYKLILTVGFLGIEILACKAGISSFKGFAKFQNSKMERYERMLIELGERNYANFANNWPVEIRLIGFLLFDAAIFFLGKLAADYVGEGVADMLGTLFGMPTNTEGRSKSGSSGGQARPMRGPSISVGDIRKID